MKRDLALENLGEVLIHGPKHASGVYGCLWRRHFRLEDVPGQQIENAGNWTPHEPIRLFVGKPHRSHHLGIDPRVLSGQVGRSGAPPRLSFFQHVSEKYCDFFSCEITRIYHVGDSSFSVSVRLSRSWTCPHHNPRWNVKLGKATIYP